jgi:dienelactone hydrolase
VVSTLPPWLAAFVIETPASEAVRHADWDLYLPSGPGREHAEPPQVFPLSVLVHGGPLPVDIPSGPRDWPVFRGYAALLNAAGVATAVVQHPLHALEDYPSAFGVVTAAIEEARSTPGVDGSRVALWHFSGGAPMVAPWMPAPPPWLRCLAVTYPILDDRPDRTLPVGFRPIDSLAAFAAASPRPVFVVVRVGQEAPHIATGVGRFVAEAQRHGVDLEVVDVPDGVHGFDFEQSGEQFRHAVRDSLDWVIRALR